MASSSRLSNTNLDLPSQRGQRPLDRVEPRVMTERQQTVDLGERDRKSAGQFRLADVLRAHLAIDLDLQG